MTNPAKPVVLHTFHGHVFHGYFSPFRSAVIVWIERVLGGACTWFRAGSSLSGVSGRPPAKCGVVGRAYNDGTVVRRTAGGKSYSFAVAALTYAAEDFPFGDLLRDEPECLPFQGHRHERTDGPRAAEILVRLDHEGLDPVGDGSKRFEVASRKLARPADVLEILEKEEIGGRCRRCRHQRSEPNAARISSEKSSGSSQAAKWPPLSTSLK